MVTLLLWVSLMVILHLGQRGGERNHVNWLFFSCSGVDVCFLDLGLLPTILFSELNEVMIAKTHLAQDHTAPVEVDIGPVWNPGTSWSRLSLRK